MNARGIGAIVAALVLAAGCSGESKDSDHKDLQGQRVASAQQASVGAGSAAEAPATQPAAGPGELMQSSSSFEGFGVEDHRVVNQPDQIVSVLKNGLTVIVQRVSSPVVSVRSVTLAGGVYEGKWLGGGLSHLLEHLVAGGSNERRTEAQNRDLLQRIGNNSNAYTTEDNTAFFVNTTVPHMEEAVDLVSGWVLGAKITVPEYRREYEVVQRELEMGLGEPMRQLYYMEQANRYRVSPARIPVIGFQSVIQKLSRDDVYTYYKMAYQPNNMIFTVVGDIDPEVMLKAVRKNVAAAPPGRVFSHDIEDEPPVLSARTVAATFPRLGQARLMIGFPSVSMNDLDMYALDLLSMALGGGESSVLVEDLRDKQQLVSDIGAEDDTPSFVKGTFIVQMELEPQKVQQATEALLKIIESVKADGIPEERLNRAKTQARAAWVKRRMTAEDLSTMLADDYRTTGDPNFSEKYVQRIEAVTPIQVRTAARRYLDKQRLLTSALFPAEYAGAQGMPKIEEVLRPISPATSQPAAAQPASEVVRAELDNGTVLLVKRISTSPTVVMTMYAMGGLTAEDAKTNGLGNLTMSMLARGTQTRSAQDIAIFFDSTGGGMGASSENNTWVWSADCLSPQFDKTMEVFADVVNHPKFADSEFGPMKKRIEAAIHSEDADWMMQAMRYFKKDYFGPMNSPYQFTKQGTEENIESFTVDQARDWYAKKISAAPRVLAIYGDVDVEKAKSIAANLLGKGEKHPAIPANHAVAANSAEASAAKPSVDVLRVDVQKTEQKLAGVVIGFRSESIVGEPATYDFTLAKTITGGFTYPTGYIFETLRGMGLVYVAYTQNQPGARADIPGTFFVLAGCEASNVNETVNQILLNMARVQGSPADINEDWFNRSKEMITTADAMDHETPASQATTAALDELYGLGYNYHNEFQGKIRAVSLSDVQKLARTRLRACVVTISTPKPDVVNIKSGVRTYDAFPAVDLTPRGVQHDTGAGGK